MSTKTVCECGHAIHEHTYSEDYSGCDVSHCNCSLDLGGLIDKQAAELATAKARAKTAEENWHKNEARIGKLESQLSWWLKTYDITMPCGHKNRYLLTDGRGDIVGDVNGNCVCVMCRLENAAEIEAELKGM